MGEAEATEWGAVGQILPCPRAAGRARGGCSAGTRIPAHSLADEGFDHPVPSHGSLGEEQGPGWRPPQRAWERNDCDNGIPTNHLG